MPPGKAPPILLEFPKDEGAHEGARHEWWYLNAHVSDAAGSTYGIMVCFFNNGKVYLAVTDETRGRFHSATFRGPFTAAKGRLDIAAGNNWWKTQGASLYALHVTVPDAGVDLTIAAERPPLLVGGQGRVAIGKGGTSYYYSQTRLRVDGRLTLSDEQRPISGMGWIDRQWGNWDFAGLDGWEWFSIHLDNGDDLLVCRIFDPITGQPITPILHMMDADGIQRTLDACGVAPLAHWTDPGTRDKFPIRWGVTIPQMGLDIVVTPTLAAQLIHRGLWEGSCTVSGRVGDAPVSGRAYVEVLQKSRRTKLFRIAQSLASLSRIGEWSEKIQTVLVAVLLLLLFDPVAAGSLSSIGSLVLYMAFVGAYGYALNAYVDRDQDEKAKKHRGLFVFSRGQMLWPIWFFAFGSVTIPLLVRDIRINTLGLSIFLLATFYSLRPFRLKERGAFGILVPALAQRVLPFHLFVLLCGSGSVLVWYFSGWLLLLGISMMCAHQLLDFKGDRKAGVGTWAQRVGFDQFRRITIFCLVLFVGYMVLPCFIHGWGVGAAIMVILLISSRTPLAYNITALKLGSDPLK